VSNSDSFTLTVNSNPVVDLGADAAICDGASMTLDAGSFSAYAWSTGDITQTIAVGVAGTYEVTVTDANGCNGSDDFVLTVNANPVVDLGADVTVCDGETVTLDAGMFAAYMWNTQETTMTIDVTTSGTYSVVVTDANGCQGTDDVLVIVNPLPVVDLGADATICESDVYTLDAGVFASYLWSTNETTQSIDVMIAGIYSVVVTDANGCSATDEFVLSVQPIPSISSTVTSIAYNQTMVSGSSYSLTICSGQEVTTSAPSTTSVDPAVCGVLRIQTVYTSTLPNIPSQTLDASFAEAVLMGAQTISPENTTGSAQSITFVSTAYYDANANGSSFSQASSSPSNTLKNIYTINKINNVVPTNPLLKR